MTRTTKALLVLSLICLLPGMAFVTGLVDVTKAVWLNVALPLGVILFGLFLIAKALEKETIRYDDEQRMHPANLTGAKTQKPSPAPSKTTADPQPKPHAN